jgi:hypothetical protein
MILVAEFASKGVAGSGLGLGIAGTALGVLNGGLGGILGGIGGGCSENQMVNRYELDMAQSLANKDMEIAYWRGQDETNRKISDTYANLEGQIKDLAREVRCNKEEQCGINMQQAVYNGTNTATIGCIQGQVAQLLALGKFVIPNGSVCPGWGSVTISPAAAPTTTG